ncbi:MAG TPA: cytochrome c oxidase subunit II, partial [Chloroflexi bacterium]|nr:cytochrome c oxidase subunit II [Chloroflexota bacterium]
ELTTVDVNHNFAIYSPDGVLLTQAQVMPGYTNKLIFEFDKPGTYTVRCLEYCGIWHQIMVAVLTIV